MSIDFRKLALGALSAFAFSILPGAHAQTERDGVQAAGASGVGAVFAMTNATIDNRIIGYRRGADGRLERRSEISTRGNGIGVDLDTQNGLQLSADHRYLYAVNAGSDTISVFAVNGARLTFLQQIFAGDQPNSLTLHGNLLYVLDGSVAGNGIRGFRVGANGRLSPLRDSFRALSSPIAVPGIVQFSQNGRVLLVTHKVTNVLVPPARIIDAFTVGRDGLASAAPVINQSLGLRPFALAVRADGTVVVVEAFNAAPGRTAVSSYRLSANGRLTGISRSVRNQQTDGCWVVITKNGRYAYIANFGSGTISSYRVSGNGDLTLIAGNDEFLGATSQPVDLALSADSRFLYLLLRGTGAVAAFRVRNDGSLQALGQVTGGLPVADGASGLASY